MASDEAKLIVKFEAENKKLHQELDRTTKRLDRFEKGAKKNVAGIAAAFKGLAGGVALGLFTKKIVDATKIQQAAVKQLEQGLASTGNVVGRSLEELTNRAADLQKASTFGDEEIIGAMSQLVTFTNITGDAFDRTTQAVLDLSTRMDQDLKSSVLQLGKALNDPVANLGALGRAGIQFSDAQKDTIKALAETNRLAEAQDIILKELERQFGGSAAAARDTLAGALASLDNAFGDLFEQKDNAKELTGAINDLTDTLQDPATVQGINNINSALASAAARLVEWTAAAANWAARLPGQFREIVKGASDAEGAIRDLARMRDFNANLSTQGMSDRFAKNERALDFFIGAADVDRLKLYLSQIQAEVETTYQKIGQAQSRGNPGEQFEPYLQALVAARSKAELALAAKEKLLKDSPGVGKIDPIIPPAGGEPPATTGNKKDPFADSLRQVQNLLESIRTPQQEYADNLRMLDSLLQAGKISQGEYNLAHAEYKRTLEESTGANAQWVQDVASAERHADLAKTEIQKLQEELAELYALAEREPDLISSETVKVRAEQINKQIEDIKKGAEETKDTLSVFAEEAARNIQDQFGSTISDALKGDFDGIGAAWANLLADMAAEVIAADIANFFDFENLLGGGKSGGLGVSGIVDGEWDWLKKSGSSGGSGGGFLSSAAGFFGGFFADGGSPDPNKISVVGEAGPELFVPNGVRGQIVPNHELGGNSVSIGSMVFPGVRTEREAKLAGGAAARELRRAMDNSGRYS
ncbi:hypothetical protein [Litorivivens sp.]|uniref:hypothetical protein n=1 Tax=Litorivivens sp. TaxID=2020868 RepID=UPI0035657ADE